MSLCQSDLGLERRGGGEFKTKQHPSVHQRSVTVDSFDWLDTVLLLVLFYFPKSTGSKTQRKASLTVIGTLMAAAAAETLKPTLLLAI